MSEGLDAREVDGSCRLRDIIGRQIKLNRFGCQVAERRIGQCIRVLPQSDDFIHPNATSSS